MNKKFAETTRGVLAYFLKNGFLKSCEFFMEKKKKICEKEFKHSLIILLMQRLLRVKWRKSLKQNESR